MIFSDYSDEELLALPSSRFYPMKRKRLVKMKKLEWRHKNGHLKAGQHKMLELAEHQYGNILRVAKLRTDNPANKPAAA